MMTFSRKFSAYQSMLGLLEEEYHERHYGSFDLSATALNTVIVFVQPTYNEANTLLDYIIRMGINPDNIFMSATPLASHEIAQQSLKKLLPHFVPFEWSTDVGADELAYTKNELAASQKLLDHLVSALDMTEFSNVDSIVVMDSTGCFLSLLNQQIFSWNQVGRYYNVISAKEGEVDLIKEGALPCYRQQVLTEESLTSQRLLQQRYDSVIRGLTYHDQPFLRVGEQVGVVGSGYRAIALISSLNRFYPDESICFYDPTGNLSQTNVTAHKWKNVYSVSSLVDLFCYSAHIFTTENSDLFSGFNRSDIVGDVPMTTLYNMSDSAAVFHALIAGQPLEIENLRKDLVLTTWNPSRYMLGIIPAQWKKLTIKNFGLPIIPRGELHNHHEVIYKLIDHARIYAFILQALSSLQLYSLSNRHEDLSLTDELMSDQMFDPQLQATILYEGTMLHRSSIAFIKGQSSGAEPLSISDLKLQVDSYRHRGRYSLSRSCLSKESPVQLIRPYLAHSLSFSVSLEGLVVELPSRLSLEQQNSIQSLLFWLLSYGSFSFKYWVLDQTTQNHQGRVAFGVSSTENVRGLCETILKSIVQKLYGEDKTQQQRAIHLISQWPQEIVYIYASFFNQPDLIAGIFHCLVSDKVHLYEAALTAMSQWGEMLVRDAVQIKDHIEQLITSEVLTTKMKGLRAIAAIGVELVLVKPVFAIEIVECIRQSQSDLKEVAVESARQLDWNRILSKPSTLRSIAYFYRIAADVQQFFESLPLEDNYKLYLLSKKNENSAVTSTGQGAALFSSHKAMHSIPSAINSGSSSSIDNNTGSC